VISSNVYDVTNGCTARPLECFLLTATIGLLHNLKLPWPNACRSNSLAFFKRLSTRSAKGCGFLAVCDPVRVDNCIAALAQKEAVVLGRFLLAC
jgi:hypothetical protein